MLARSVIGPHRNSTREGSSDIERFAKEQKQPIDSGHSGESECSSPDSFYCLPPFIHRAAEKKSSRKPNFRCMGFSEIIVRTGNADSNFRFPDQPRLDLL